MKFCGLQKEKWKCLKLLVVDLVAEGRKRLKRGSVGPTFTLLTTGNPRNDWDITWRR